jgi:nitrate reductase NapE component
MNTDSSNAANAAVAGIAALLGVYFIVAIAIVAFTIWMYWRIFAKAGYSGSLSLLNLVPGVGPVICVVILAFGRWPIEDQLAAMQGGRPYPPPAGSAVIPQ